MSTSKTHNSRDYRQELTDKVIAMMEMSAEYETPWFPSGRRPRNPVTGTVYRGVNALSLMSAGFADSRFYTFNNIKALNEKAGESGNRIFVRKGEKGVPVFKAKRITVGPNAEEVAGEEKEGGDQLRTIMIMVHAGTVFNAEQIDGLPPEEVIQPRKDFELCTKAEFVIEAMQKETGLKWRHANTDRACYSIGQDEVLVPEKTSFKSRQLYYRTALHELGHSTGHPSRLNRPLESKGKNLSAYAFEELIAEITSYFMEHETGIEYDPWVHKNHAAYLQGWIEALKNDKNILFKACGAASKASDYIVRTAVDYRLKLIASEEFGTELPVFDPVPTSTNHAEFQTDDVAGPSAESEIMPEQEEIAPAPAM